MAYLENLFGGMMMQPLEVWAVHNLVVAHLAGPVALWVAPLLWLVQVWAAAAK